MSSLPKKKILVLWSEECNPQTLQSTLSDIREEWNTADVLLEHVDRLKMAEYSLSTFDQALLGVIPPPVHIHSADILVEIARILKPSGTITLREPCHNGTSPSSIRTLKQLHSSLRLAGFINPRKEEGVAQLINEEIIKELGKFGIETSNIEIITMKAEKPSYEIGTSTPLRLGGNLTTTKAAVPNTKQPATNGSSNVWTLAANDMLDDDLGLLDSDTLLQEEDLIRPDPSSLKSNCGPSSGKKKACKNCTCGLAEMDSSNEVVVTKKTATSSCGSCYLGDAFRCASCPYLGMPAFKPGQEIKLSDRQLTADQ